jgi:hypothetical protein
VYSKHHGEEHAAKILAKECVVLERINNFVRDNNVQCDFNYTTTFDCCMTPEFVEYGQRSFAAFRAAGGDVSHVNYYEGEEATKKTGINGVLAAYEWPAGSSHPAKLAHCLLNSVISRDVRLFTHCPVTSVTPSKVANASQGQGQL